MWAIAQLDVLNNLDLAIQIYVEDRAIVVEYSTGKTWLGEYSSEERANEVLEIIKARILEGERIIKIAEE